jgi:EmrB/QacA subfamily drug resistance transporter
MNAPDAGDRRRWRAMPFIALGVAMIIVDATIINVAIPTIIRDLDTTATTAEWVNSIYSLVFAALLITLGRVGDMVGRRRLFALGTVWFVAASVVAATAPSGGVLIFGRFLQGIGGAMILPATLSTVNSLFVGRERAIAFAIWGSTIGGMAAVGPFLGGLLTTELSWRWAFLINVPLGIAILIGLLTVVPETSDPKARRGIDVPGQLTLVLGLAALVFGLIEGQNYGWWTSTQRLDLVGWPEGTISPVAVALAVAVVALGAFVMIERARLRAGKLVVVDLRLFSIGSFSLGNVAALIVALGEFGLLFVLPLYLQGALGLSALATGAVLIPLAVGTLLAGGVTAQLAPRLGPRGVVQLGLLLEGRRHRHARPGRRHGHGRHRAHPVAVRLRRRRRVRHRAAHGRDPHRRAGRRQRAGLGHPEHVPPGRLGARHRDPRHDPAHEPGVAAARRAANRPRPPGGTPGRHSRGRAGQRRDRDPGPARRARQRAGRRRVRARARGRDGPRGLRRRRLRADRPAGHRPPAQPAGRRPRTTGRDRRAAHGTLPPTLNPG